MCQNSQIFIFNRGNICIKYFLAIHISPPSSSYSNNINILYIYPLINLEENAYKRLNKYVFLSPTYENSITLIRTREFIYSWK